MYSTNAQQYPTYTLNVANIHLSSGTTLTACKLPLITEILDTPTTLEPTISKEVDPTYVTSLAQAQSKIKPLFPEKLIQSKLVQTEEQSFNIID